MKKSRYKIIIDGEVDIKEFMKALGSLGCIKKIYDYEHYKVNKNGVRKQK